MAKTIKVFGYDYTIDRSDSADLLGTLGRASSGEQVIKVALNAHPQQAASVAIHEILHVICFHGDIDLAHRDLTFMETGLYQALTSAGVDLSPLIIEEGENGK